MAKPEKDAHSHNLSIYSDILADLADQARRYEKQDPSDAHTEFHQVMILATGANPWFTATSIADALNALAHMVRPEALEKWLDTYTIPPPAMRKRIGLILAGNIPLVGFHDIFTVAFSQNRAVVKPSAKDNYLLPHVFDRFFDATHNPDFQIEWFSERLPEVDAVIATGSNNTSRYFEYYFGKYPHIIRKSRSSVAILTGSETDEELSALGTDIFSNFGLGCRNVSKLYVHEDFDLDRFFKAIYPFHDIINHHKYANNFDYYRALWMLNNEDLLENGFLLLRPSEALSSPIGTLFYQRYDDADRLREELNARRDEIQCIVSLEDVPFGKSQQPELWDYADGVDTMDFLLRL